MKLHEITDDELPLVWMMVRKLVSAKKRVDFGGTVETGTGNRQYVYGEVVWPHRDRVDVYAHSRNWVYMIRPGDDERFKLEEIKVEGGSYYKVIEV